MGFTRLLGSICFLCLLFSLFLNFGPRAPQPIVRPSGSTSQDPRDSQIYEVILTIVYVKQIISGDEWLTLVMKLHQA